MLLMMKTWILKMMTYSSMASFFWMKNPNPRKIHEQYWGAAKLIYRSTSKTTDIAEMERNVS
jgi:hypothetical protein